MTNASDYNKMFQMNTELNATIYKKDADAENIVHANYKDLQVSVTSIEEMNKLNDLMGVLGHGVDYLIDNGAPSGIITRYMKHENMKLAKAVASVVGGNSEDIADKDKRTPEQDHLMMVLSGQEQMNRLEKWLNSDYVLADTLLIERYCSLSEGKITTENITVHDHVALHTISLYFFTKHKEIIPINSGGIGEAEKAELFGYLDTALEIQKNNPRMNLGLATTKAIGLQTSPKPKLSSILPVHHVMPNNKLTNALTTNSLTDSIIDAGSYELEVIGKGSKAIAAVCILSYEGDNVKITGRQPFTEYDRNVYNAVTSIYVYGDSSHIVTPATVYRAMVNMTETETPSDQQIEAVTRSLDKMRFIRARVDCTAELTKRGTRIDGEQITGGKIDTYLLAAESVSVEAGGKTIRAYRIIKTPILYEYSSLINQVLTIPAGLLDIKENGQRVRNTERRIAVKGYLLRRIEGMKGKNSLKSDTISFESYDKDGDHHAGIYERADASDASRTIKQQIRDYTDTVLRYWTDEGYIAGYEFIKDSGSAQAIKSIRITLK